MTKGYSTMVDNSVNFNMMLEWHLKHNHYPPVHDDMIDVCVVAIDNANDGNWEAGVELPQGFLYLGHNVVPTWKLVDAFHLDDFLSIKH
jgi:hypothetical protein